MLYTDNTYKFTAVLNARIPAPKLMNALAHATAGLADDLDGDATYLDYPNAADGWSAKISLHPFIILQAKNSSQIASARAAAKEAAIKHNVFVSTMIGSSADDQIARTREATGEGLDYWALVLFGDSKLLQPITKKFSLLTINPAPTGG
ncbi:MAG: DUF2000 family protein [Novosphingobium sp.]|jgi:hypothetical protein|uniref:DUF2000 family protein n=1 Tax=Novosphingobium sp. TaxID=1874826 RepID=UPI0022CB5FA6|nr:DUF2000 family protein [Novosphingobium sp.]MCZ8036500.1 DUF2000 family protein [Novosphingobium sp.]